MVDRVMSMPVVRRLLVVTASATVFLLGLRLVSQDSTALDFLGAFLIATAGQVGLWALGIQLEILGNAIDTPTARDSAFENGRGRVSEFDSGLDSGTYPATSEVGTGLQLLQLEMRGRISAGIGYVLAELSMKPGDPFESLDEIRLAEAVGSCQQGYRLLTNAGSRSGELMALNNLVYYSCVLNDITRKQFLLEKGRVLLREGQETNASHLILTGARAILQFSSDSEENQEMLSVIRQLIEFGRLSKGQAREAKAYLERFAAGPWLSSPNRRPQADA